jgi:hypothetical protein
MALHEQPFELFALKARFAGSMVVFDPRRAFCPADFLSAWRPSWHGSSECGSDYLAVVPNTCEMLHITRIFFGWVRVGSAGNEFWTREAAGVGHGFWTSSLLHAVS